jgi:hypothetical protein
MKNIITSTIALSSALFLGSCAAPSVATAPTGAPDATLSMSYVEASYLGTASSGNGTLNYQGKSHPFSVQSVNNGGTSAESVDANGKVYNLNALENFPGTYTVSDKTLVLLQGKTHERFENNKGTVIYVEAVAAGVSTSMKPEQIVITLK